MNALPPDDFPPASAPGPTPNAEAARDIATFEALLWALSRPGMTRALPPRATPDEPVEARIAWALVDRECRTYAADPTLAALLARTGASPAPLEAADHVFLGATDDRESAARIAQGSDLYPDDGATLVLRAGLGHGPRLRLTGPGVDGAIEVTVAGLPAGFWAARARAARYPMGCEIVLIDGDTVMGVPRSTQVEAL
ncbi:MAG: phosphonate C-P lyase system protein PhnH [Shimia sp.]